MVVGRACSDAGKGYDDEEKGCGEDENRNEEGNGMVGSENTGMMFDDEEMEFGHNCVERNLSEGKGKNGCCGLRMTWGREMMKVAWTAVCVLGDVEGKRVGGYRYTYTKKEEGAAK